MIVLILLAYILLLKCIVAKAKAKAKANLTDYYPNSDIDKCDKKHVYKMKDPQKKRMPLSMKGYAMK